MSENFVIKGGGVGRLMANAILNFHFDYWHTSLMNNHYKLHHNLSLKTWLISRYNFVHALRNEIAFNRK